jgi:hypothetical protein
MTDITEIQENAWKRHQEVLNAIEALSDRTSSDRTSSVSEIHHLRGMSITCVQISGVYSGSHNRYVLQTEPLNNIF